MSTLHPATTRVYRAAGWEIGGDLASYRIATRALERLPRGVRRTSAGSPGTTGRRSGCATTRSRPRTPAGSTAGTGWWDVFAKEDFADQCFVYGVDGDDGLDGYLVFAQKPPPAGSWGYRIVVEELVARDPSAAVTLWRFLGGHGMQVEQVTIECGPIDELLLVLPEQDVEPVLNNRWMHRLVDAPAAIAARGYPPGVTGEVHLDVTDRLAPWNEGHWVLRVEGGRGELVPGGTGEVQLGINGFSSLSTGWASTTALLAAGALHHASPADRSALDAAFAGPPPTMVDEF